MKPGTIGRALREICFRSRSERLRRNLRVERTTDRLRRACRAVNVRPADSVRRK